MREIGNNPDLCQNGLSLPNEKFLLELFSKGCFVFICLNMTFPSLVTDVDRVRELLAEHRDSVTCVLSTTSCFAPRTPDK